MFFLQEWKKYKEEYGRNKIQPAVDKFTKKRQELENALLDYVDLVLEYRKERDEYSYKYFREDFQTKIYMGDFHIDSGFTKKHGLWPSQLENLYFKTIGKVHD